MRRAPALLALMLVAPGVIGCGSSASPGAGSDPERTVTLKALCPGIHTIVDGLVASSPESQQQFLSEVDRLWDAASDRTRDDLTVLRTAAQALVDAGTGPDFYAARDGIHAAVVEVDGGCVAVGSPILHGGPH